MPPFAALSGANTLHTGCGLQRRHLKTAHSGPTAVAAAAAAAAFLLIWSLTISMSCSPSYASAAWASAPCRRVCSSVSCVWSAAAAASAASRRRTCSERTSASCEALA